jgi:hypothetical protein
MRSIHINLGLLKAFESRGIEFAYPTQKLLPEQTSKPAAN